MMKNDFAVNFSTILNSTKDQHALAKEACEYFNHLILESKTCFRPVSCNCFFVDQVCRLSTWTDTSMSEFFGVPIHKSFSTGKKVLPDGFSNLARIGGISWHFYAQTSYDYNEVSHYKLAIHDIKFSLKHTIKPDEKFSILLMNEALFHELFPHKSMLSVTRIEEYVEERAMVADSILKSERKRIIMWASSLDSGNFIFQVMCVVLVKFGDNQILLSSAQFRIFSVLYKNPVKMNALASITDIPMDTLRLIVEVRKYNNAV